MNKGSSTLFFNLLVSLQSKKMVLPLFTILNENILQIVQNLFYTFFNRNQPVGLDMEISHLEKLHIYMLMFNIYMYYHIW